MQHVSGRCTTRRGPSIVGVTRIKMMQEKGKSDQTDKYCYYCGQHGHMTINCEFMVKLINATEHLNKVDSKLKKELQEHFCQKQKKRRAKRIAKQASTIQKLIDTGGSREEIEHALAELTQYNESEYLDNHDGDTHSDSSSQSE
jgi:hypothetical protein